MKTSKYLFNCIPLMLVLVLYTLAADPVLAGCGAPQDTDKIIADGEKLIQDKPWKALSLYQKALETDGENAKLLQAAGKAAFLSNDMSAATEYLYAALGLEPEFYTANLFLGKALRQQGQEMAQDTMTQKDGFMMMEDSLKFFRKAVDVEKASGEPCLELAYTLYSLYDFQGADDAARQALERNPEYTDALLLRGDLAFSSYTQAKSAGSDEAETQAMWENAIALYTAAAEKDKVQTRSHMGMAALYEWSQGWNEAGKAYLEALARDPGQIQAYTRLLIVFRQEGVEGLLSEALDKVIATVESNFPGEDALKATPLYYQGIAYLQEENYSKSMEALDASMALNEQFKTAVSYYRFRAAYGAEDRSLAAQEILGALRSDRDGLIYFMQIDSEFLTKVYMAVRFVAFDLGNTGRNAEARDLNACLLSLVTNDASLYNDYALGCRETRMYEEAYTAYIQAIALDPENCIYPNDAALILQYYLRRDLDEAERLYNLSIEKAQYRVDNSGDFNQTQLDDARLALRDANNNLNLLKQGITEWPDSPPQ